MTERRDWGTSPDILHISHQLGELNAKADFSIRAQHHHSQRIESLHRSLDATISAWQTYTQQHNPSRSGPTSGPIQDDPKKVIKGLWSYLAPKAAAWAMARIFGLFLAWILPSLILAWAVFSKHLWTVWQLVLQWLH